MVKLLFWADLNTRLPLNAQSNLATIVSVAMIYVYMYVIMKLNYDIMDQCQQF